MNDDDRAWFSAKRFGIGAGVPLRWQGWLAVAIYCAVLIGALEFFRHDRLLKFAIIVPVTILFLIISARTTRGGWRWRWGDDE